MLSLVTAAEQQYRFEAASRAHEEAVLRSIRDRELALATESARARRARHTRETRPRPSGAQRAAPACATA